MWQWLNTFAIVKIMPLALTNLGPRTYFIFGSIFGTASSEYLLFAAFYDPRSTVPPAQ